MIGLDVKAFSSTFFDRAAVMRAIPPARRQAFRHGGGLVRQIARRSIRKPRRLSLSEMSPAQQLHHKRLLLQRRKDKNRGSRGRGRSGQPLTARPQRPWAPGVPGQPPRDRTGTLKKLIFFGYDTATERMLIGPAAAKSRTAGVLEHKGFATLSNGRGRKVVMYFRGNPFMRPALKVAAPSLPALFRNAVRG